MDKSQCFLKECSLLKLNENLKDQAQKGGLPLLFLVLKNQKEWKILTLKIKMKTIDSQMLLRITEGLCSM